MRHILPFLLFANLAFSQSTKAIRFMTDIDEFTGDTSISTTPFLFGKSNGLYQEFIVAEWEGAIYLYSGISGDEVLFISEGNEMLIKLSDNTIMQLTAVQDATSEVNDNMKWVNTVGYLLGHDYLKRLASTPIKVIRVETATTYYDFVPVRDDYPEYCRGLFQECEEFLNK